MEISILKKEEKKLTLSIKDATPTFANSLRRTLISEIENFSIDEVHFYENTSPMFNEYLANRLALIPLTYEDSDAESITLSLDAEAIDEPRFVYSKELISSDPVIKVAMDNIPIIKLGKGQKLRLEAIAIKGKGKTHMKFQDAMSSYGFIGEFKLAEKCKKCASPIIVRDKVVAEKTGKAPEQCYLCENCEEKLKKFDDGDEIIFFAESFNNLSADQQIKRALESIESALRLIEKEVK